MRNLVVQALPAGAVMTINVEPPMADDERPILLPFRGSGTVVVRVIHNACLEIENTTSEIAPFAICVGKPPQLPPQVQVLANLLIHTLRNR
jgi:hypothetical protein